MDPMIIVPVGALEMANTTAGMMAGAKLKLFKSTFTPTPSATQADFAAAECDYTGYAAKTIAAWLGSLVHAGGGASIAAPTQPFHATGGTVTDIAGGCWLEVGSSTPAKLFGYGVFTSPIAFTGVGTGVNIDLNLLVGKDGLTMDANIG